MFCCYFLSILYQWIKEDLFVDKFLDHEHEIIIELQPITHVQPQFVATAAAPLVVISLPTTTDVTDVTVVCDENPKEVVKEESMPPITRLRKQIQAEEEFYKEDFEIIDINMIDTEKKE